MNNAIVPGFDDERTDNLIITLQKAGSEEGCLVMYLDGHLDTFNAPGFQKKLMRAVEAGFAKLVINLAAVSYVGSSPIGVFAHLMRTLRCRNGDVVLVKPHPRVYEVFQLLGFASFFQFVDSTDEAVGFFSRSRQSGAAEPFPKVFGCPVCEKRLRAVRAGRFRCPECKTILGLDTAGAIILG